VTFGTPLARIRTFSLFDENLSAHSVGRTREPIVTRGRERAVAAIARRRWNVSARYRIRILKRDVEAEPGEVAPGDRATRLEDHGTGEEEWPYVRPFGKRPMTTFFSNGMESVSARRAAGIALADAVSSRASGGTARRGCCPKSAALESSAVVVSVANRAAVHRSRGTIPRTTANQLSFVGTEVDAAIFVCFR
jgi:hypothetical protein